MTFVRALIVLAILAIIAFMAVGAIYVTRSGDKVIITVDEGRIKHATNAAVEKGKEAFRKTETAIERERQKLKNSDGRQND